MTKRHLLVLSVAGLLLVESASVHAQGWRMPPPTNLQVLDKDIARPDLLGAMKSFTSSLGVRCQHCHAYKGNDPDDLSAFDFASDEKKAKSTARGMMRMVTTLNGELVKVIGEPTPSGGPRVTCYTCHRGEKSPVTVKPTPIPANTPH